jgi:hypothetical protein
MSPEEALGSLLLAAVRPSADPLVRRAIGWARDLDRLGVELPLAMVHDVGLLMATPRAQLVIAPRVLPRETSPARPVHAEQHARYVEAIRALADDETLESVRAMRPSDDLVVALLARVLGARSSPFRVQGRSRALEQASLDLIADPASSLPALYARQPHDGEIAALGRFADALLRVRVALDTLDLDTVRLLATYGAAAPATASMSGALALEGLAQVELLAALGSLQANDVVNFSLELLPTVLETTRRAVPGTYASGGYSGLTRRGSLDSLVLTELAWDDAELVRRIVDDEVLFHARERSDEQASRVHLILVDASASMRGDRTTFARGVAIALAKRLEIAGEEARVRFFDRRLYEPFGGTSRRAEARRGALATMLPHILAFVGERGRSPERVLRALIGELDVLRARDHRQPVVHLVTHAAFYASRSLIAEVKQRASLFGVFITPQPDGGERREPPIDFLDLLDGHHTVDQSTLARRESRAKSAIAVVQALPEAARRASVPPPRPDAAPRSVR